MLLVMTVCAAWTGQWFFKENPYCSYSLQANAWLHGQLDLGQDYPWLELAIYEGKYYVSFPPFPSYVLLPFALLFGTNTPDGWIAWCVTLIGVWYAVKLCKRISGKPGRALFWTLFMYLGSGYLFISLNGYVWFIAQTMCFTLSILALYCADRGRCGTALSFWACAVGCRPMTALYLPILLLTLWRRYRESDPRGTLLSFCRTHTGALIGPCLIGGSYMLLNWLRFGNVLEFGHNYLPEFTRVSTGQFDFSYFLNNLPLLFRLPQITSGGALALYTSETNLFVLVDPFAALALLVLLVGVFRQRQGKRLLPALTLLLSAVYVVILCCHRTLGGWQFGNRYFKDILPWVFFALAHTLPDKDRFDILCAPFFLFGLAVNVCGTIATYNGWI